MAAPNPSHRGCIHVIRGKGYRYSTLQQSHNLRRTGAAAWASYLINGDASGLTDEERNLADQWCERELGPNDAIVDCGEPYFTWHYKLHTGCACRDQGRRVSLVRPAEINALAHDYLAQHPELYEEAFKRFEKPRR